MARIWRGNMSERSVRSMDNEGIVPIGIVPTLPRGNDARFKKDYVSFGQDRLITENRESPPPFHLALSWPGELLKIPDMT